MVLSRAKTPEPVLSGPRLAADLQMLSTIQQMALQQQTMAMQISELHHMFQEQINSQRNCQAQMVELQAQLQVQLLGQTQIQMRLAESEQRRQAERFACMQPSTDTAALAAASAAAEAAAAAAAKELEEQRVKAAELQAALKKRQRPGARMRRRMRSMNEAAEAYKEEEACLQEEACVQDSGGIVPNEKDVASDTESTTDDLDSTDSQQQAEVPKSFGSATSGATRSKYKAAVMSQRYILPSPGWGTPVSSP
eukprot:gnl/TRDRNA2_/TRDRNA2_84703_c0_seq1.p1 gnl/TRDRNA2_/TRDRNA2_84703_c0~~gnl/TRDRNA2_/TRDRNA2_84703_c0_seq1.p1  ORF type:complete len:252 (-),score=89.32 gnl/TRDRNA2_/TRDRNA2_84703_c0_seq1:820-1575(-)